MTVSWKAFWAVFGAVLTGTWAGLAALIGIPAWATIPVFAAVAWLFSVVANRVVHGSRMFHQVSHRSKRHIVHLLTGAAAAHTLWVVVFALRPTLWPVWLLVLAGVGAVEYLLAHGQQYLLTQLKPVAPSQEVVQRRAAAAQRAAQREADKTRQMFETALVDARLGWVKVKSWKSVGVEKPGDKPYGAEFLLQVPSARAVAQTDKGAAASAALGPQHAEPLAIALANVLSDASIAQGGGEVELHSDWVTFTKLPQAGAYSVTVVNEDVMDRTFAYVDDQDWTTMATPAVFGKEMNGRIFKQPLAGHSRAIGGSRWGKSSQFHVEVAHCTKADAVVWVGGVEKLYDLVAGWIESYRGKGMRPPIDWIANGQLDTLRMVVAAMNVARWRQRQPMHKRVGWPYLIVFLDEVSFFADNRRVTIKYQGQDVNAGQILATCMKGAASANVLFKMASQRSTNDQFGDKGGEVNTNWMYSSVFHSADEAEVGRVMGNAYYKLENPAHRGECWLRSAETQGQPRRMKVPYIQSVDPTQPLLHSGPTLADVAWARRLFERELDAGSQRAAGEHYERRHTMVDDEMMRYLTGDYVDLSELGEDEDAGGMTNAAQAGYDFARASIEAMYAAQGALPSGGPATDSDGAEGSGAGVAVAAPPAEREPAAAHRVLDFNQHRSLADRVAAIIRQAEGPVTKEAITTALTDAGVDLGDGQVLTNALTAGVKAGAFTRKERGIYVAS